MTTYAIMRAAIADEMANDGALTEAQINKAILRSIKHYERRPWWFNQKTATFSTVVGQEYYSSSDLADIPDIVSIFTASYDGQTIRPAHFEDMDAAQTGLVSGTPTAYTLFKEQLRLFPIPDAVASVRLSYTYRLAELSADADSNAWTTDAEELIRQSAKKRIALDIFQADDLASRFAILEREAFDEILAENRRRRPVKLLTPPPMLQSGAFDIVAG